MIKKTVFAITFAAGAALWLHADDNILSLRESITDDNIVFPESFETDTQRMMQNWYLRNYTELDANVDNTADAEVSDEEIERRLAAMPTVIEMPFNSVVRKYIDMYTSKRRSLIENMLGMSLYYMPIFEQALEREGVPLELRYLPIIESALNPDAVSRAGATGLWQFMLPTARGLGMEVSSLVDERRDPYRSSEMAAKYLKQLYEIYNDWSLAIAAYNCGPGNVNKALRRAGGGKKDFWDIYYLLPAETRGYVPCFIAANYVMTYYGKHNISPALARKPIITDTISVSRRVHFEQISEVLDIPIEGIRVLNPQYRESVIPGDIRPYTLVLPSQQVYSYIISEDSIVAHNADKYIRRTNVEPNDGSQPQIDPESDDVEWETAEVVKWYKVRKGDTFSSIARKYGVTASSIKSANGIKTLRRGRTIKIVTTERVPKPKESEPAEECAARETASAAAPETAPETAPAAKDDANIRQIAENTETPESKAPETPKQAESEAVAQLQQPQQTEAVTAEVTPKAKDNGTSKDTKKKDTRKKDKKKKQSKTYTVKSGDSLSRIAKKHGTTVKKLQQLNGLKDKAVLQPGQKLKVS